MIRLKYPYYWLYIHLVSNSNDERLEYCILLGGCTIGVLGEGITLHQSWKENTGKLPLGLSTLPSAVPEQ